VSKHYHGVLWIGFGSFAKRLLPYVEEYPGVRIKTYFHPDREEAIKRFGSKASWDIDEAMADPEITTVFITTPNDLHSEFIKSALLARKHVFVEKPITAFYREAVQLLPTIRASKSVLAVGHHMRREATIRKAKDIISEGGIGRIVSVYANHSTGFAFNMDKTNWRFFSSRHREGPLLTVGVHLVEVLHYLLGLVDSVSAVIKNRSLRTDAPDSNAVLLSFKGGASAFLESNYSVLSESMFHIHGTEGTIYIDRGQLRLRVGRDVDRIPTVPCLIPLNPVNPFKEEIDEFFDVIEAKKSTPETGYQEAVNALAVIEACYRSSLKEKIVSMKSFRGYYSK